MVNALKKVAVIIPFYRDTISDYESIALQQCAKVLGNHPIIAVKPESLTLPDAVAQLILTDTVSFNDSYCFFDHDELWIKSLHIAEYVNAGYAGHKAVHDRKLLLTKKELSKWHNKIKEKGFTIVPMNMFINEKGYAKLEIGLGKGKKLHDKRESIKSRDVEREIKRYLK